MEIKIGLCGKMRVGKDTVANYLAEEYGFMPFAFGDRLKEKFHLKYPHIPKDPKPVRGYQLYGQLERYVASEDVWIDYCLLDIYRANRIGNVFGNPIRPLITDMRQPNEFERLTGLGYVTIRVEAPLEQRIERIKASGDDFDPNNLNFETETDLDRFNVDYVISNEGSLEQLYDSVDEIMHQLEVRKILTI